ncbi:MULTISPECIES: hypothetical protein [unclassified Modestobacter]|uniref:hypothetical protein n=1 Tax=unclassified Modestobacter TaxID=2643866 RepID=UPI0022AAB865|nr:MULTISPECIES: hypothetical protein [unclassified Modestobacter]MCZ2823596.1 hypothetical protein [Modestobacter sp. VKM Ac-2981]MCZ2851841.1 hypothetical protein [Modestobacter sp. VKM Ac-2982]
MSGLLPTPMGLPDPPGSPAALGDVLDQLASAGFAAGTTVHLLGAATVDSGWQGADAAALTAEVATARTVAGELHGALATAAARLGDHRELWLAVLTRIADLRADQREQFARAGSRLAVLVGPAWDGGVPGPGRDEAADLSAAVAADDVDRAAEHRALLDDLAADATAVAAVLAAVAAPLGGAARLGDAAGVTAWLAGRMPGWGDGAFAALGREAAADLLRPGTAQRLDAAAARWSGHAASPAFAAAVAARLGAEGLRWLLTVLGEGDGSVDALADLLAGTLGSVAGGAASGSPARRALGDLRLPPADPDGAVDVLAVGMGTVLGALAGRRGAGVSALAASWGRQFLAREAAQGAGAAARVRPTAADPVETALTVLRRAGDAGPAGELLADPAVWTTLLSRPWPGGTEDLAAVVTLAAAGPGAAAGGAALQSLGRGVAPDSPDKVLVDQETLAGIGAEVSRLVAGQVGVVLPVLEAAVRDGGPEGRLDASTDAALRGLALLFADEARSEPVVTAVHAALAAVDAPASSSAELVGATVAVQEHGQRLRYGLAYSQEHEAAVDRQLLWTLGVTVPSFFLRGPRGDPLSAGLDLAAIAVGADGEVRMGPDTGRVRTAEDAQRDAVELLGEETPVPGAVGAAARTGFAQVAAVLGSLGPPEPSLWDRLDDPPRAELPEPRPPR